jgi:hypothetical protein
MTIQESGGSIDVVVCGGVAGAEVADRHHSYGSYLHYNSGN